MLLKLIAPSVKDCQSIVAHPVLNSVRNLSADRVLGTVVVGGFMFARGSGQDHWDEVKKFRKQHIQKWHVLQESAAQSKNRNTSE